MSRPIKFRAWHKPTKSMLEVKQLDLDKGSSDRGHTFYEPRAESPRHPYYRLNVDDCIVMQFTGLTDKNGKEIYEGDILKDDVGDILEVKFGELPLDKSGDCVCSYQAFYCKNYGQLGQSPADECQNIGDWMEVIGNIHENPELVNV